MIKYLTLALIILACVPEKLDISHEHEGNVAMEHSITISETALRLYFDAICRTITPALNDVEILDCINQKVYDFINHTTGGTP